MALSLLRPSPTLNDEQLRRSLGLMVWEGVASGAMFSLGSGGLMAAFALALGANNLQVGILAALPFLTQIAQLPVILAVERFRRRKLLGVPALLMGQLLWLPMAAVPFFIDTPSSAAVGIVIIVLGLRGVFMAIWTPAWSSWMHALVPREALGRYYGRRLAFLTVVVTIVGLGASFFVPWWESQSRPDDAILAYSFLLILGALTFGLAGPILAMRANEPLMPAAAPSESSAVSILLEPLRDKNFQQLLRFLFVWSIASNLAIPFFAVYMLVHLDIPLPMVIALSVLGQVSSVLFLRVWGPMADRMGLKVVMSLAASLYLLVILSWTFTALSGTHQFTIPLIVLLHFFAGVASAGVTLAAGALSYKLAPPERATAYNGAAGVAINFGTGIGAILGGFLSDFFVSRSLELQVNWNDPAGILTWSAPPIAGFDFLFLIAFVLGLLSLNILIALTEEGEMPRDAALSELMSRFSPTMRAVSSVPGVGTASALSYTYLKRVPGADVALGVTAYQIAASAQMAAESARHGRAMRREIAERVRGALNAQLRAVDNVRAVGREFTRQAARGAMHARSSAAGRLDNLVAASLLGSVRAAIANHIRPAEALRASAYGIVQGAIEAGEDPESAAKLAVEAAREASTELPISEEEAVHVASAAALDAAIMEGGDAPDIIRAALTDDAD